MKDQLNTTAQSAAAVGLAPRLSEMAHAEGLYHGVCRGFKPQHEREYLHLHPQLLAMRAKRDKLLRWMPQMAHGLVAKFLKELADFEAFMESLTEVKWAQLAPNVVTTPGKNVMLDAALAGSNYTVVGPYMGLIGAASYVSVPVIGDTMASHATWTEAGATNAPTYTGPRKTIAWSAAASGSKAPSAAPVFAITGTGTAKGVFIAYGTGALSTIDNTAGTLFSAALFTGGDQAVVNTNTVTVTYTIGL